MVLRPPRRHGGWKRRWRRWSRREEFALCALERACVVAIVKVVMLEVERDDQREREQGLLSNSYKFPVAPVVGCDHDV